MKHKPRSCATCGVSGMIHDRRDVFREFEGVTIRIADVEGWFCPICNEVEFDTPISARNFFEEVKKKQGTIEGNSPRSCLNTKGNDCCRRIFRPTRPLSERS